MAGEVRRRVLELYGHQDPAVKQAADAALREFQGTPLAWGVAQELLADADPIVQFFGAQTLYGKVQQVAKGYESMQGAAIQELAQMLRGRLSSGGLPAQCRQRLALALGALAAHACAGAWPTAVPDVLSMEPQCAWSVVLAIPEQLSTVVHGYLKTDKRTLALLGSAPAIFAAASRCEPTSAEEAATGSISDTPFSLACQCLAQWSKTMGMDLCACDGFAAFLARHLAGPAGHSEPVLELLIQVLQSSSSAFALYARGAAPGAAAPAGLEELVGAVVRTMGQLLPGLQQMADRPPTALDEVDGPRLSRWARVAAALVEAYTQILWVEQSVAEVVISFLGLCFLVHPHVAQCVFELWATLKDTHRDNKFPSGVLEALLRKLAPPCIGSLARFGRRDSPQSEEPAALLQLREAQQEIVVDIVLIAAGTSEAATVYNVLHEHLQRSVAARDWHGAEVIWFAFTGVAEALADEASGLPDVFPSVFASVCQADIASEDHCITAATLLRVCGPHFEGPLLPQLVPAVQWLVQRVAQAPAAASDALQEICGYAGQHLVQHIGELLKVVEASAAATPPEVDASLHGALAAIARHLPADGALAAFGEILRGAARAILEGPDVAQEAGRRALHRSLCRLLRCTLVAEQAGGASPEAPASVLAAAGLAAAVAPPVWPALAAPCRRLLCAAPVARDAYRGKPIYEYSDEALQVDILAFLRYAAKAANEAPDGGADLADRLMELAAACCAEGQLAGLGCVALLASQPGHARARVLPALPGICQAVAAHTEAGRPAEQLVPFLEIPGNLATSLGEDFFQAAPLAALVRLGALALASGEQDILKPVLGFILRLLMSRSPAVLPAMVEEVVGAVLSSFHHWPRSTGMQTFKVFSALLERHEALFLPRAVAPGVPAVDGLPAAEQALARQALRSLRGPRLRAFLGDLGAVARSDNTLDVLQAYAVVG